MTSIPKNFNEPERTTKVKTAACFVCGNNGSVELPTEGLIAYNKGAKVQDAFPNVSKEIREQFISGIHPPCWNTMFGKD